MEGIGIAQGGDFGSADIVNFGVSDNLNTVTFNETSLSIYPNPTSDIIFIQTGFENISSAIYDINGRQILSTSKDQIDLSGVANGIYFIKVKELNSGDVITKKIIKQ